ncbi:MAG: ferritin-like domain-containing protein [bacterium]|nr:ferritin-like domain-containing protein [bacterium]
MSYYGSTEFRYNDDFALRMRDIRKGNLDLGWMKAGTEQIQANAENGKRGFTYLDINQGSYGYDDLPELPRGARGPAPRGAAYDVDRQADLEPELNRKSDVWAYKVASFTEEAMSRQWDASTDVPWGDLEKYERSNEVEIAFAQLCTFFTEVEMIATDLPAKWVWRMNDQFQEVKHFIATQAMDEARHAEVFRKRALAGGVGLMHALPQAEHSLKAILDCDNYSDASAFMHLLAEGNILTMFRFSEYISPTPVDKRMFQLVMQDEARHVSYGLQHLRWVIDHAPERKEQIHLGLDSGEEFSIQQFDSSLMEAMIVLAGKGTKPEQIKKGIEIVGHLQVSQVQEYFNRLRRAGFAERIPRSKFLPLLGDMGIDIPEIAA